MGSQKGTGGLARVSGKLKDEAHVLRELEPLPLEKTSVDQLPDIFQEAVLNFLEQLVDIMIVEIKGGSIVAGAVGNLPHGEPLDGALGVELQERFAQIGTRLLGNVGLLLHGASSGCERLENRATLGVWVSSNASTLFCEQYTSKVDNTLSSSRVARASSNRRPNALHRVQGRRA